MSTGKKKGSEHTQRALNAALPTPAHAPQALRKPEAFQTLAVADVASVDSRADIPRPSDLAVKEARDWVEYDEM